MYGSKEVSKVNILELVTPYDIFRKYILSFQEVGKAFCSELRNDKTPTCFVYYNGSNLKYKDFAETGTMDCFDYVQKKYDVNFYEALEIINLDFNLDLVPKVKVTHVPTPAVKYNIDLSKITTKPPTEIKVKIRKWAIEDKLYWKDKYDISIKELKYFKVFPISGFWVNDTYFKAEPCSYAYYFGKKEDGRNSFKIYQPYSKSLKFITNCTEFELQGYDQLPWMGETLIITKSMKDVIALFKIDFSAVAPHGETVLLNDEIMNTLKKRFNKIFLLYDNDVPGQNATKVLSEKYGIPFLYMPEGSKDASDFVELYSYDSLKSYLNEEINTHGSDSRVET